MQTAVTGSLKKTNNQRNWAHDQNWKLFVFSMLDSCQYKTLADCHYAPNITAAVDEWQI